MNQILRNAVVFSMLVVAGTIQAKAQCPSCTPDVNCTSTDNFPTVCPIEMPVATAGQYYEQVQTFYLPAQVTDPGTGIDADLLEVVITNVVGIPFGMEYTMNNADNTYHPQEGENHGCANYCGTPILPGVFDIIINVQVTVYAIGQTLTLDQQFPTVFIIEPGEGGNSSFTYDMQAGCGELDVNFAALLNFPTITTYDWDFGNGESSTEQFPGTVHYDSPGDYTATLTTTISDYVLMSVSISGLNGNWGGDIDDTFSDADVWFTLTDGDGNVAYTSSIIDNDNSPSWGGLDLTLANPPYVISFTDDDLISQDDNLGSSELVVGSGDALIDCGNGSVGTSTTELQVSSEVFNEQLINVFPIPGATFAVVGNVLSYFDPNLTSYIWILNDEPIQGEFESSLTLTEGGVYSCVVGNEYGCTSLSQEYLYCPDIEPGWDEETNQLTVPEGFETYQWYLNGLPLDGANYAFLDNPENGNYSCTMTTDYGCTIESEVVIVNVGVNVLMVESKISLYPNPGTDSIVLNLNTGKSLSNAEFLMYDLVGHNVMGPLNVQVNNATIDVSNLPCGQYIVEIKHTSGVERLRWVKSE